MNHAPPSLRPLAAIACASLAWGTPEPGHGQSADHAAFVFAPRAWVGILADVGAVAEGRFAILVRDVHATGPAHRGGVVPGDRIVALNGEAIVDFEHWLREVSELESGEPLTLTVVRGGATLSARIIADRRPGALEIDSVEMDAVQSRVWQRFDSIYDDRMAGGGGDDSVFFAALNPRQRLRTAEARVHVSWERSGQGSATLRLTMRTGADSASERERADLAVHREERARQELAEVAPALVGGGGGGDPETIAIFGAEPRSLTLLQGRRWILLGGLLVRDLTDELGQALGVAEGALVTDVPHGSPASRTGFRAGDVIAGIAGQPVRSVLDLRIALAETRLPVGIVVVRRGETIELAYPPG